MLSKHDTLVIMINMGLHFIDNPVKDFSRQDYQSQMTMILTYLHNFAIEHKNKNIFIYWRETTAQHFPTSNGYWPGVRYSNHMKLKCVPIQDTNYTSDWRNRIIEQIIWTGDLYKIQIISFYNITLPLWSSHPNGHMKDCTHFCWYIL